jgi:orotate phosphoribosyltransferase
MIDERGHLVSNRPDTMIAAKGPNALRDDLLKLIPNRRGHFRFESNHHGNLWLELDRLFLRPSALRPFVAELARRLSVHRVESVCGPMVGGAFLAQMLAEDLGAEFCFAEQVARESKDVPYPVTYRIPAGLRATVRGKRVAIVDDVINAGSAVRGALAELRVCGAEPVAIGALLTLGSAPAKLAERERLALESLAAMKSDLWEPAACPLCAAGVPLEALQP